MLFALMCPGHLHSVCTEQDLNPFNIQLDPRYTKTILFLQVSTNHLEKVIKKKKKKSFKKISFKAVTKPLKCIKSKYNKMLEIYTDIKNWTCLTSSWIRIFNK